MDGFHIKHNWEILVSFQQLRTIKDGQNSDIPDIEREFASLEPNVNYF